MRIAILCCSIVLFASQNLTARTPGSGWPQVPALPRPTGEIITVSNVDGLFEAAKNIKPGGTIFLADGHYMMPRYFEISTDGVTLRSASGNRGDVILDGISSRHGELLGVSGCKGVTIADLTIQNIKWNGIKINSDRGASRVTVHNCVIHNVWQRGVKAPAVPKDKQEQLSPRDCRIQYCMFYNDRPKRFTDDETDTPETFNGNYIGGIDAKNTIDWKITDNLFIDIQGRTREGRGSIYISENGRGCLIERNTFVDCDIAIALGNPSLGYSPLQAVDCVARNNLIWNCPESGILACYTSGCKIQNNTVYDPRSKMKRLIWVQNSNEGLEVAKNLLIGPPVLVTSKSNIVQLDNVARGSIAETKDDYAQGVGQSFFEAIEDVSELAVAFAPKEATAPVAAKVELSPAVVEAMRKVHVGFEGQAGYVAQFGDSITYSMAFWSPIGWDEPQKYLTEHDGLPKTPANTRWRDYVKGTRDKGPKFANYSGWRVGQLLKAMDAVLERDKPEAAIIMIGTNDISGGRVPETYRANLEQVIRKCTEAHCIPILNTIPPRRDHDKAVDDTNAIIREVAKTLNVPLADFHAECLRLRPGDSWDGTIISKDGVHPSGGKSNVYTSENQLNCGYALRNWLNFLALRQVYFRVLNPQEAKATHQTQGNS